MLIIVEAGHVGTWELTIPLSLLFHIFGKVRNKSSGKSQRQFLLLWGNLCGALLQVGKLTAPDPSQEEPQDRVLPSSLSSVWEQSAKTEPRTSPGKPSLAGALWSPVAISCAGQRGKRKSLRGGKPQGIHHAALSKAASSWPWLRGSWGARAGHLGRPCLSQRQPQGTLQPASQVN